MVHKAMDLAAKSNLHCRSNYFSLSNFHKFCDNVETKTKDKNINSLQISFLLGFWTFCNCQWAIS